MRRALALALGLVLLIAAPAQADHGGLPWKSGDIHLVTDMVGTGMEPYLRQAAEAWDASPYITITVDGVRNCKAQRNVVSVCIGTGSYTELKWRNGYLVMAAVTLPYVEYYYGSICHELGHALGLFHTIDNTSCMYSYEMDNGAGYPGGIYPSAHDFAELARMYG